MEGWDSVVRKGGGARDGGRGLGGGGARDGGRGLGCKEWWRSKR
jgi:hypothetical protein